MEKVRKLAMALPAKAREALAKELMASLPIRKSDPVRERADEMFKVMTISTGHPVEPRMRDSFNVWARSIIAFHLAAEGFTETAIGRALGRDHSSVNVMKKRVTQAISMPTMYPDVVGMYNSFRNNLNVV